jgi:hypothetical protein
VILLINILLSFLALIVIHLSIIMPLGAPLFVILFFAVIGYAWKDR